jgi:phage tail sheath protein FI
VDVSPGKLAVFGNPAAPAAPQVQGIYALVKADIFNMLCLPTDWQHTYSADQLSQAATFCAQQRAMLVIDPPAAWSQAPAPLSFETVDQNAAISGSDVANAAVYFPNLLMADPVTGATVQQGPCGAVAGVWASTDDARGVWKAPAGTAAALAGISDLAVHIDDAESGVLNPIAVNCLRTLPPVGPVSWGARTAAGADELASQWKYIPVRRTALFIEESVRRGTQWVVFEPNDEPLWSSVRLNIGAFMNSLFKQGAFQGSTPAAAYLVKCDADNNPQSSINQGILNILVGFQPLVPAEFVIIQIEQLAGQLQG